MSAANLRAIIEYASGWAEKTLIRRGKIAPIWHAVKSNGEYVVLSGALTDSKDISAAMVRAYFELHDVVRCVFISEAWTFDGIGKSREENERVMKWIEEHDGLSDFPGVVEVVTFCGEDADAGQIQAHRQIIRGKGKLRLGPLKFLDMTGVQSEGRFIGMLPRRAAKVQ
jgi:hypothetical protein